LRRLKQLTVKVKAARRKINRNRGNLDFNTQTVGHETKRLKCMAILSVLSTIYKVLRQFGC